MGGAALIGCLDRILPGTKTLDGISGLLTQNGWTWKCAIAATEAAGLLFFRMRSNGAAEGVGWIIVRRLVIILLGIGIGILICLAALVNTGVLDDMVHPLLSYLHITDEWGTLRSYVWRRTVEYWKEAPMIEKLFGIDPDTAVYVYQLILPDGAPEAMNAVYDNAHNELLQLLLTHGFLGMVSYYGWCVCAAANSIWLGIQKNASSVWNLAVGVAMIGYFCMMLTCVNSMVVTVIPFLLLSIGRREMLQKQENRGENG